MTQVTARAVVVATLTAFATAVAAGAQDSAKSAELFPSARAAAFNFAVRAGLKVPDSAVFVREPDPVDGMERRVVAPTTSTALMRDADDMAKAIGRGARAGFALDYLTCARACSARTTYPVVAVGEVTKAGKAGVGVLVILFEPGGKTMAQPPSRTSASVIVEAVGDKWRAVSFHPAFTGLSKVYRFAFESPFTGRPQSIMLFRSTPHSVTDSLKY